MTAVASATVKRCTTQIVAAHGLNTRRHTNKEGDPCTAEEQKQRVCWYHINQQQSLCVPLIWKWHDRRVNWISDTFTEINSPQPLRYTEHVLEIPRNTIATIMLPHMQQNKNSTPNKRDEKLKRWKDMEKWKSEAHPTCQTVKVRGIIEIKNSVHLAHIISIPKAQTLLFQKPQVSLWGVFSEVCLVGEICECVCVYVCACKSVLLQVCACVNNQGHIVYTVSLLIRICRIYLYNQKTISLDYCMTGE